jgi:hypothetical protein
MKPLQSSQAREGRQLRPDDHRRIYRHQSRAFWARAAQMLEPGGDQDERNNRGDAQQTNGE